VEEDENIEDDSLEITYIRMPSRAFIIGWKSDKEMGEITIFKDQVGKLWLQDEMTGREFAKRVMSKVVDMLSMRV
jgi:hypothetical protein